MKKNEFIEKLDAEIMPAIRQQILEAYEEGYEDGHQDSSLDGYLEAHNLHKDLLVDLGLPSGTIWIPIGEMTFTEAKKRGLQFPTEEQILELIKCKQIEKGNVIYIKGLNSREISIAVKEKINFALWTDESYVNEHFNVDGGTILDNGSFYDMSVYAGDKFRTMFVLPDYVK